MNAARDGLAGQGDVAIAAGGIGGAPGSSGVTFGVGAGGAPLPSERGWVHQLSETRGIVRPGYLVEPPKPRPACATFQCRYSIQSAWFSWIDVSLPPLEVGQQNLSYWYGLRSIDVRQRMGQEVRVLGLHYRMLPPDVAGEGWPGMGAPIAWGDATGMSAAIVIGRNLPCRVGAWRLATAVMCGINSQATLPVHQRNSGQINGAAGDDPQPDLLFGPLRFPTGQLTDVSPNIAEADISMQGDCAPVLANERLDVALVVAPQYLAEQTGQLAGFAQIDLVLGHTINDLPWSI